MGSGSIDIWLLTEPWRLFNSHQIPQSPKPLIANSADDDQMFRSAERAEPFAMIDDALGETLSNSRKRFQFVCRRSIDVD